MASEPPKPDARVIAAYLEDVILELDAAKRLVADPPNRFAAFHLQQAAEKLIKSVRLALARPSTLLAGCGDCFPAHELARHACIG